jgi:glyoxylase-like metal-dependent hydrolase (beta-lactamase superfamily II)
MQQIVENLYTFTGLGAGRVYCIVDNDGLTIIDASIASATPKILKQLEEKGHKPQDIKRILITHAHPDHVGALAKLKAATGAIVMTSALEKPVIQGEIPIPVRAKGFHPPKTILKDMSVDRELANEEVLPEVFGGLQAILTPGHAPGHLAFWQLEKRVLICGDVIFNIPRKMRLPLAMLTVDMEENRRSISKIAALEPKVLCFGHGKPITENTAEQLRAFAQKHGL